MHIYPGMRIAPGSRAAIRRDQFAQRPFLENRFGGRRRVLLAAQLVFGTVRTDCIVKDLNCTGARIYAPAVASLPERVHLLLLREGLLLNAVVSRDVV